MTLLDDMARAICLQNADAQPCPDCKDGCAIGFRLEAKAALAVILASLREPSGEMMIEGNLAKGKHGSVATDVWCAMLDQWVKENGVE